MLLTDRVWLPLGMRRAALDLCMGDLAQFTGGVAVYRRGLSRQPGERTTYGPEYGLPCPGKCSIIARAEPISTIVECTRPEAKSSQGKVNDRSHL